MKRLLPIQGKELIKILCNKFGFQAIRQKGSHVTITNGTIYLTVPLKEIRVGLLGVILRDCGKQKKSFSKKFDEFKNILTDVYPTVIDHFYLI